MSPWIFVSPASRGIGLEAARFLLQRTTLPIVATARRDLDGTRSKILEGAGKDVDEARLTVLELDVTEEETIAAAAKHCASLFPTSKPSSSSKSTSPTHLHLALLLPGILHPEKSPSQISAPNALQTFKVNTLGPLLLLKHFSPFLPTKSAPLDTLLPPTSLIPSSQPPTPPPSASTSKIRFPNDRLLAPHAVFATVSARVGSISDNTGPGGWYSYRASKAGVNQLMRTLDQGLRARSAGNAVAVALHPGTVKTGLSERFWAGVAPGKLFSARFAAERLVRVLGGLGAEEGRGRCWDWKGEEVPP